jgi:hypothetical protein
VDRLITKFIYMKTREEILDTLPYFSGTTQWFRHPIGFIYTDGVMYVAESCQSFWLLDLVGSVQYLLKDEPFQVIKLTVKDDQGMVVIEDGNDRQVYKQEIEFTDFPLDSIELWLVEGVLMLPSEY